MPSPHHAHCFAGFLQLLDKAGLIFRQNLGTVFRDAQLAADGAGCGFAVPVSMMMEEMPCRFSRAIVSAASGLGGSLTPIMPIALRPMARKMLDFPLA